jgi:hypothetical protein
MVRQSLRHCRRDAQSFMDATEIEMGDEQADRCQMGNRRQRMAQWKRNEVQLISFYRLGQFLTCLESVRARPSRNVRHAFDEGVSHFPHFRCFQVASSTLPSSQAFRLSDTFSIR